MSWFKAKQAGKSDCEQIRIFMLSANRSAAGPDNRRIELRSGLTSP